MTMRRNIFVSTACLPGVEPLEFRLALYQQHCLRAIELGANIAVDETSIAKLFDMDCCFLVHNYFPPSPDPFVLNLASVSSEIRQRSIELAQNALELSARLGAPFYSVHAGFVTDPVDFGSTSFIFPMPDSPNAGRQAIERFIYSVEILLERAEALGVKLLVENNVCPPDLRGRLLLQTADEFLSLFGELSSPWLGLLVDTGHLSVSAHTWGFSYSSFIQSLAPYIRAFHIHDNTGEADTHQPVSADSWIIDALTCPDFRDLPVVIEAKFRTVDELVRHVEWIENKLSTGQ